MDDENYAYAVSFQVTAWLLYGGIVLPFAIGAVVNGVLIAVHTPLSGQFSPVFAVVPRGSLAIEPPLRVG